METNIYIFKIEERDGQFRVMRKNLEPTCLVENAPSHKWWKHNHQGALDYIDYGWVHWFCRKLDDDDDEIVDDEATKTRLFTFAKSDWGENLAANIYDKKSYLAGLWGGNNDPAFFDTKKEAVDTIQHYYGTRATIMEGEWKRV